MRETVAEAEIGRQDGRRRVAVGKWGFEAGLDDPFGGGWRHEVDE